MILARFEFHPEYAADFGWSEGQQVVELQYDNIFELIEACQSFEEAIKDVTAIVDGTMVSLKGVSV